MVEAKRIGAMQIGTMRIEEGSRPDTQRVLVTEDDGTFLSVEYSVIRKGEGALMSPRAWFYLKRMLAALAPLMEKDEPEKEQ